MAKEICTVCGREIDSRGMSGHMRTHKGKAKKDDTNGGVISYPSGDESAHPEGDESTDEIGAQGKSVKKQVKKQVKKRVVSKPASSPASKPDTRGQHNSGAKRTGHPKDSGVTETEHKKEWQGLFRD